MFSNTSQVIKLQLCWNSEPRKQTKTFAAKCFVYVDLFCFILKIHILIILWKRRPVVAWFHVTVTFFFNFKKKVDYDAPPPSPTSRYRNSIFMNLLSFFIRVPWLMLLTKFSCIHVHMFDNVNICKCSYVLIKVTGSLGMIWFDSIWFFSIFSVFCPCNF